MGLKVRFVPKIYEAEIRAQAQVLVKTTQVGILIMYHSLRQCNNNNPSQRRNDGYLFHVPELATQKNWLEFSCRKRKPTGERERELNVF